jgi:hypothetical protein
MCCGSVDWEASECSDWLQRQTVLLLLTDWKHGAFPVACSEPVNCGNVLMLGSSNWLLTERQSACGLLSSWY